MILLFPGAFKPFHDGHFLLLRRYVEELSPEKVYIVISNKERSGITAEQSKEVIEEIFAGVWKDIEVNVEISDKPSPINYCYGIIGNDEDSNEYVMINSSKDNDKRIEQFYELFKKGGKYYHSKSYASNPEVETEPLYYWNRKDDFADSPISSAIVRNDIIEDDWKNFKKAYENIIDDSFLDIDNLETFFDELKETVTQSEDDLEKLERYIS